MKRLSLILFFIFLFTSMEGIGQSSVKGILKVQDSSFLSGNLLILDPIDSSLVTGQYLNEQKFEIGSVLEDYILKIQMLGYEEKYFRIEGSIDLGEIKLVGQNLEEITVSAEKLPFQNTNGRAKMNIQNSIFSNSASFQELIQKMPGVVIQGDELVIIGRGNAKIFIDGIETNLNAASSLPASQIESIEVIKNPDASVDADGMAVIRIKTKKQKQNGITGTVLANYTKAFHHLGYVDFNAQLKYGKWSFNVGANCNIGQTGVRRISDNYLNRDSSSFQILSDYRERTALNGVTNWITGIQYNINPNHLIGIQYNGNYSDYSLDVQTDLQNRYQDSTSFITALANDKSTSSSHRASFNYNGTLDSLGSNIFFGFTYSHLPSFYSDSTFETTYSEGYQNEQITLSDGENRVHLYTGQLDYSKTFNAKYTLKTGLKYNYSSLGSHLSLQSSFNVEQKNQYGEQVGGAYVQGALNFDKIQFLFGFRMEYTRAKAVEEISDQYFLDSSYFSYFPHIEITIPSNKWTFTTKFSSNIDRPSFNEMTPYIYYVNSMFGVRGNPYIRPSLIYGIEQQFAVNESGTSINVGYRYTSNPSSLLPQQNSGFSETVYQRVNLTRKDEFFLELNQSLNFKNFYCYLSSSLSYEKYSDNEVQLSNGINFPKFYLYAYFKYSIPKWLNIEVFGSLTTAYSNGFIQFDTQGDIGLAISRRFFKNKLLVQISGNDLFQTAKIQPVIGVNGEEFKAKITQDTRYFRVSITYNFGKLKDSKYRQRSVGDENENRAK